MLVEQVTELRGKNGGRKKYRVTLSDGESFALYRRELESFDIQESEKIGEDTLKMVKDLLLQRGKEYALYLLQSREKTTHEMREALRAKDYPEETADEIISFLRDYHYLDDACYAKQYIRCKKEKSIRQLEEELRQKGISKEKVRLAVEECGRTDEEALYLLIHKKMKGRETMEEQDTSRLFRSLMSRGFCYEDARRVWADYCSTR